MKKLFFVFLLFIIVFGLISCNLPNTLFFYELNLRSNPINSGTFNIDASGYFAKGETVSIEASAIEGFEFVSWTNEENEVVSDNASFNFKMPKNNVALTANFINISTEPAFFEVNANRINQGDPLIIDIINLENEHGYIIHNAVYDIIIDDEVIIENVEFNDGAAYDILVYDSFDRLAGTHDISVRIDTIEIIFSLDVLVVFNFSKHADAGLPLEDSGTFRVSDFGAQIRNSDDWFFYRGYIFEVNKETHVTHLIGGGNRGTFTVVLYEAEKLETVDDNGNNHVKASNLLGHANIVGNNPQHIAEIIPANNNVILAPGNTYILAQGRRTGTGGHYYVHNINVPNIENHSIIKENSWEPDTKRAIRWDGTGDENHIGQMDHHLDYSGVMPAIGFLYDTDVEFSVNQTLVGSNIGNQLTFKGLLNNTGNDEVSLYIEWNIGDPNTRDGTLSLANPEKTNENNISFSKTINANPNEIYYYRAVTINERGRVEGDLYKAVPMGLE